MRFDGSPRSLGGPNSKLQCANRAGAHLIWPTCPRGITSRVGHGVRVRIGVHLAGACVARWSEHAAGWRGCCSGANALMRLWCKHVWELSDVDDKPVPQCAATRPHFRMLKDAHCRLHTMPSSRSSQVLCTMMLCMSGDSCTIRCSAAAKCCIAPARSATLSKSASSRSCREILRPVSESMYVTQPHISSNAPCS